MIHFGKGVAIAVAMAVAVSSAESGNIRRGLTEETELAKEQLDAQADPELAIEIFEDLKSALHSGACTYMAPEPEEPEEPAATVVKDRNSLYIESLRSDKLAAAEAVEEEAAETVETTELGTEEIEKEEQDSSPYKVLTADMEPADLKFPFDNYCRDTKGREVTWYDGDDEIRYCCRNDKFNFGQLVRKCTAAMNGPRACVKEGGHGLGIGLEKGFFSICCEAGVELSPPAGSIEALEIANAKRPPVVDKKALRGEAVQAKRTGESP